MKEHESKKILLSYLRQFDSSAIYERGQQYFKNGMVYDLDYNGGQNRILAQIYGSQRNCYTVKITLGRQEADACCTCLYDGSPCKHAIAVILEFLANQQKYIDHEKKHRQKFEEVKAKLESLSKAGLVDFILKIAEKRPDFRRDLFIRFENNKNEIIGIMAKNVENLCRKFEEGNENSKEFAMKLQTLTESLENGKPALRLQLAWIVADRIIGILNKYGIGYDEALENMVSENLETVSKLLGKNKNDTSLRTIILKGLLAHYLKHNCGAMDCVSEVIFRICVKKSDYETLITETKRAHRHLKEDDSYYRDLTENLLKELKKMSCKATA